MDALFWVFILITSEDHSMVDGQQGSDPLVVAQLREVIIMHQEVLLSVIKKECGVQSIDFSWWQRLEYAQGWSPKVSKECGEVDEGLKAENGGLYSLGLL